MPKKPDYIRAKRLQKLPPYLFAEIDRQKEILRKQGKDIIDLSVGNPDLAPPAFLIRELQRLLTKPGIHRYPPYEGIEEFRQTIAQWYRDNLKVAINPESEVWSLLGTKEGLVHLILAVVNPGDVVLVPDPYFPPYRSGVIFAGGMPQYMPLRQENNFLPDLSKIPRAVANRAKLMFLNYPNNPTGAMATKSFYQKAIQFASKYGIIVCQDAAYEEIYFNRRPISFLEVKGAKEVGIETRSFSKMFSIPGWRMGWIAGNSAVVKATGELKTNLDSGVFMALQKTCCVALKRGKSAVEKIRNVYKKRRNILVEGLKRLGWKVNLPPATFYVWIETPPGYSSLRFSQRLLNELYIASTPGIGFGTNGEGFIRLALTVDEPRLIQALSRFKKINLAP